MGERPARRPLRRPPQLTRRLHAGRAALLAAGLVLAAGCGRDAGRSVGGGAHADPAPPVPSGEARTAALGPRFVAGEAAPAEALPADILRGLGTDARILDCAGGVVDGQSALEAGWVAAHAVDLDGDGRDDWLVEGRHRCLVGDDGADWWAYAGDPEGHRLLLAAARARAVELVPPYSHGFLDLKLQRDDGAGSRLRYDGTSYTAAAAGE